MTKTKTYFEKYFFVLMFSSDSSSELSLTMKLFFLSLFEPLYLASALTLVSAKALASAVASALALASASASA